MGDQEQGSNPAFTSIPLRHVDVQFPYRAYDCQSVYMSSVLQCLQEVRPFPFLAGNSGSLEIDISLSVMAMLGQEWLVRISNWYW